MSSDFKGEVAAWRIDLAAIGLIIAVVMGMAGRREHRRELSKVHMAT